MHSRASEIVGRFAAAQRTGLVFVDEYGHRRDYTFAEICSHSQRYAAVLRAFGLSSGDRVYVSLSSTAKCAFTLLALERLGAQPVFDVAGAAGAAMVIANREYRPKIEAERERLSPQAAYVLIGEECEGWARLDTVAQMASPAAETETASGEDMLEQARTQARERLGAVDTDVVWCAMQFEEGEWFERALLQPWLLGAAAVVHNQTFDAQERLDLVRELDVTILLQRAEEYHAELALPDPKRFKMPRLRRCIVLDEAGDALLERQWAERFGVQLVPPAVQSQQPT